MLLWPSLIHFHKSLATMLTAGPVFKAHQHTVCGYGLVLFIPPTVSTSAVEHHCSTRDLFLFYSGINKNRGIQR